MGKKPLMGKCSAVGIILLFIMVSVIPSTGMVLLFDDDTTPPMTLCSLDPAEPDGENGWYVGSVTVFLNATDDDSGVNVTKYRVDYASWETYTEPFLLEKQGAGIIIEYYSVDNAGNVEPVQNISVNRDITKPFTNPLVELWIPPKWGAGRWSVIIIATARDDHSGMSRVEIYMNTRLYDTVFGPGPTYSTVYPDKYRIRGFLRDTLITDDYIILYTLLVSVSPIWQHGNGYYGFDVRFYDKAGNMDRRECEIRYFRSIAFLIPGFHFFKTIILPNNYTGYIGSHFIDATFSTRSSW
jgi:hypothetical protein